MIKKSLLAKGVKLSSDTDSELIAQLIGIEVNENKLSIFEAVSKVVSSGI